MAGLTDAERFADLIVEVGANVQEGQEVEILADLGTEEAVRAIAGAAYRRGARFVEVWWWDPLLKRERLLHARAEPLDYVPPELGARVLRLGKERGCRIWIIGNPQPHALEGIDPERGPRSAAAAEGERRGGAGADDELVHRFVADGGLGATGLSVASAGRGARAADAGARARVAPRRAGSGQGLARANRGVEGCRRAPHGPCIRVAALQRPRNRPQRRALRQQRLARRLLAANRRAREHRQHPDRGGLHDTRPGAGRGSRSRDEATRACGQPDRRDRGALRGRPRGADRCGYQRRRPPRRAAKDDGAARLGEVALVDGSGRIGALETVFWNTLLDENASSHIALGGSYEFVVEDEAERALANQSEIHVDFMIGSPEVDVDGITRDGERVPVLRGGDWQI